MVTLMNHPTQKQSSPLEASPSWMRLVSEKIKDLQFGSVMITIHDGRVTQIESTEKIRFQPEGALRSSN